MTPKPTPGLQRALDERAARRAQMKAVKQELAVKHMELVTTHGMDFEVRPMSIGRRLDLYDMVQKPGANATAEYLVTLVLESTYTPGTGEREWNDDEADEVRDLPADVFGPLSLAAQRVNATTKESDDAVGNASADPGSDVSSSESPENSAA